MANAKPAPPDHKSAARARRKAAGAPQLKATAARASTGEFKLALPSKTIKTLSSRKARVRAIMEVLSDQIVESQKSGRATSFLVEVDPHGVTHVRPGGAEATQPGPADDDDLEAALAAARERGRLRAAEILSGGEMLSADAFADLLGVRGAVFPAGPGAPLVRRCPRSCRNGGRDCLSLAAERRNEPGDL